MKRIPGMKYNSLTLCFAACLLSVASLAPAAYAADAIVQSAGNVKYVSGGVGADSIDQLNALSKDFNLKLVFAMNSGNYVSDVAVAITDPAGKTLLNTTSNGPWLLTRLPAGTYKIVATFAGTAVTRQTTVGATALSIVDMRWASE